MIPVNHILPHKLEELSKLPDLTFVHDKRILLFGFTPQWINYFALISLVLVHRGCKIDFVWTPVFEHDHANLANNAQWFNEICAPTFKKVQHESIQFIDLRDLPMSGLDKELREAVNAQSHEDVIHFSREVDIIPEKDYPELYCRRKHYNYECIASLLTLMRENDYDLILEPNGKVFEWGAVYRLGRHLGVPISTIENLPPMDHGIIHSWDDPAIIWNEETVNNAWERAAPHKATEKTYQRVQDFKKLRNDPDSDLSLQFCKGGEVDQLREQLKLPSDRPVVLMLPSMGYEKFFRLEHRCFRNSVEWFNETVKYLAYRDDCTLIIRAHPYPYGNGREDKMNHSSSGEIPERLIKQLYGSSRMPGNIRFIEATDEVNTYDLMDLSDWSITYSSGASLDMALNGKASIVASSIHYNSKGFTYAPNNKLEYFQCMTNLLTGKNNCKLTRRQIVLAHCYIEFFYYTHPRAFPWHICAGGFEYNKWPLDRLLSLEGIVSPYMDTFDLLVERKSVSDEKKLSEITVYIDNVLAKYSKNEIKETLVSLGNFKEIDITSFAHRFPMSGKYLADRWPELMSAYNNSYVCVNECLSKGKSLAKNGLLRTAAECFEGALQFDIYCADAWYNIGKIFVKSKQHDSAVKAFSSGLIAQPSHADCKRYLNSLDKNK
jgi:hypothetical protein